MRAPMIPGRKPDDSDQREAMLRRLGIAEEKPRTQSRWDILARDLEPAPPVQTPPPLVDETPVEEPLPAHQPIPMTTETIRAYEAPEPVAAPPEPVVVQAPIQPVAREPEPEPQPAPAAPELVVVQAPIQPVAREPGAAPEPVAETPVAPEPQMDAASFMSGWGEESIPEDEEVEAFDELETPVESVEPIVHQPRWMDGPVAEAPRREELLPVMERPAGYGSAATIANDEDLDIPPLPVAEAPAAPVAEARVEPTPVIEPPVTRAPVIEPVESVELAVARQPEPEPAPAAEPVARTPVVRDPFTPAPEPQEPAPTIREPEPEPVIEAPVVRRAAPEVDPQPEPVPMARRQPAGPPVDAALLEMRAELEAMRKQFQTAPQPVAPIVAAIPYERRKPKSDFFANARMVVWTLGIVWALWVTFHALQAASAHPAKQDQIIASVTAPADAEPAPEKTVKTKATGRRSSRAHRTE